MSRHDLCLKVTTTDCLTINLHTMLFAWVSTNDNMVLKEGVSCRLFSFIEYGHDHLRNIVVIKIHRQLSLFLSFLVGPSVSCASVAIVLPGTTRSYQGGTHGGRSSHIICRRLCSDGVRIGCLSTFRLPRLIFRCSY